MSNPWASRGTGKCGRAEWWPIGISKKQNAILLPDDNKSDNWVSLFVTSTLIVEDVESFQLDNSCM